MWFSTWSSLIVITDEGRNPEAGWLKFFLVSPVNINIAFLFSVLRYNSIFFWVSLRQLLWLATICRMKKFVGMLYIYGKNIHDLLRIPDSKSLVSHLGLGTLKCRLFAPSPGLVVSKSRLGVEDFGRDSSSASDFFNLLLVKFLRAETIATKRLIQGRRNKEIWVGVKPSTLRYWPS